MFLNFFQWLMQNLHQHTHDILVTLSPSKLRYIIIHLGTIIQLINSVVGTILVTIYRYQPLALLYNHKFHNEMMYHKDNIYYYLPDIFFLLNHSVLPHRTEMHFPNTISYLILSNQISDKKG